MARHQQEEFVARPFEGLNGETNWVALHDIVPIASGQVRTTKKHGAREVVVATMLPGTVPAWHRTDGVVMLGLQNHFSSQDISRDLAQALLAALDTEAGTEVRTIDIGAPGPRLQDVLDPAVPLEVELHEGFDFWVAEGDEEMAKAVEDLGDTDIPPVHAVEGLGAGYWTELGGRPFLRWVRDEDEDVLLDGLARLQAVREAGVVEGAKYAGAFRACGLMVPVWELPDGVDVTALSQAAPAFAAKLDAAIAVDAPLTPNERRARAGLVARQVTLR